MKSYFESYEPMDKSGVVLWTPFVEAAQVIEAYQNGVFPWPEAQQSVFWFSPLRRGVLDFKDYSLNRSTQRSFRKNAFEFKVNFDFKKMIETCAEVKTENESETWITEDLIETYCELHKQGWVHSFECHLDDELVGGVYGVFVGNYFSAESMFYKVSDASKFAFDGMIKYLSEKGLSWIDTQMVTPFTEKLGAKYISRNQFLSRLARGTIKAGSID